ncbi:MarR family winged helix-turn-helix transcriptional regulator [Pseudorhodoferax soli]|uniref:DNA-binding MarR family transcriptional regulator n=1 Tax=Pseudorhodoferax soli TaxID=545864 RepID=A0A368XKR5_9BURK|nr:MarR family winged helix-turn-helix transcriptional regulator [Pseudorhodoferax soli]RCW68563.1 DNA-binding MarR family transcriptional regulator [Pseudorhodoferax soli]
MGASESPPPAHGFDTAAPATPTDRSGYKVKHQVGHLLRRAYQRHIAIFQERIPDSQLTMPQFVTLCAVRDLRACSLNEIVAETSIDQATIRGVVERLVSRKLLAVAADAQDKRKVSISLTATGTRFLAQIIDTAEVVSDETFGELNAAERVALVFLLKKMCGLASE